MFTNQENPPLYQDNNLGAPVYCILKNQCYFISYILKTIYNFSNKEIKQLINNKSIKINDEQIKNDVKLFDFDPKLIQNYIGYRLNVGKKERCLLYFASKV